MTIDTQAVISALTQSMPAVLRWAGAVAKQLRNFNIAIGGAKSSGYSNTDALTLADLTLQDLIVAALRDGDPILRQCRIEAEETTGDLEKFSSDSPLSIALDPIDGTKCYRDKTGGQYSVMLHLRNPDEVLYSLVYIPETGKEGTWVEVQPGQILTGPDDFNRPARAVLDSFKPVDPAKRTKSKKIYMIGYQRSEPDKIRAVTEAGLEGVQADLAPKCLYELFSTGEFAGSLIHTPNVYDFPVSTQIARQLGGDAVWVHNGQPVHFRDTWLDERSDMVRLKGITACSPDPEVVKILCNVAKNWNPNRYLTDEERQSGIQG